MEKKITASHHNHCIIILSITIEIKHPIQKNPQGLAFTDCFPPTEVEKQII